MRNGTQSNGQAIADEADVTEASVDYYTPAPEADAGDADEATASTPLLLFVAVSLACAAAAIATGSYAVWLSRHRAAQQTLTDVQDILRVCQDRMSQLESDLNHLPSSLTSQAVR